MIIQVCIIDPTLTPVEDGALVWHLAMVLQCRAVPALVFELVLAFMNGHLYALQGRGSHIGISDAQPHLPLTQAGQSQTHCIGGQNRISCHLQAKDVVAQHTGKEGKQLITLANRATWERFHGESTIISDCDV